MDVTKCLQARELIESILAGCEATAELRKMVKAHLASCPSCRRHEFTRRIAIERQAVAPPWKQVGRGSVAAEHADDLLLFKIRSWCPLSIRELSRFCQACNLLDDPECRARALAAVSGCAIEKASFCAEVEGLATRNEQDLSVQDGDRLRSHVNSCLKCWTLWTYEHLVKETAALRAELREEARRGRFDDACMSPTKASAGASASTDAVQTERMYRELRFLLLAGDLATKNVERYGAVAAWDRPSEECTEIQVLLAALRAGEEVSAADRARVHEHLENCMACRTESERRENVESPLLRGEDKPSGSIPALVFELHESLLPFLLSRLRSVSSLSLAELDWVCSVWAVLPGPQDRAQVAEAMMALRVETGSCCEGIERFLAWESGGELSPDEENYLRTHLRECNTCWPLWHYRVLLQDAAPLLEERGLVGQGGLSGCIPAEKPASDDSECARVQRVLVSLFEGRSISEAESAAACRHLDRCCGCSSIEAQYRLLFAEDCPEAVSQVAQERARLAGSLRGVLAAAGARRPLTVRELGWLSLTCVGTSDWQSRLLTQIGDVPIQAGSYCPGIEELVRNRQGLSPLARARLESHIRGCGNCWTLVRCSSILQAHAERESPRRGRAASRVPWYRWRWAVMARRVAVLLLVAVLAVGVFKSLGRDSVGLLIQKVEAADIDESRRAARELAAYPERRVVQALGSRILADVPPELVGECVASLVRIGTKEAFDLLEQWENLRSEEQRVVFPAFWTAYARHDREAILKTVLEAGSPRLVKFFMADSLSHREGRVVEFLRQVVETRSEVELQIDALRNLQRFRITGGLDLGELLDRPNGDDQRFASAVMTIARLAGDSSITERVIARLLETGPDWDESTYGLLTHCQRYLFSASDTERFLPYLADTFVAAEGSTKTSLAVVLAEKGNDEALGFLAGRLAEGEGTERQWIIGALNEASNRAFIPYVERILDLPCPSMTERELAWLKSILERLRSVREDDQR